MEQNKRKIIQIDVNSQTDNNDATLFALCDDGTVWSLVLSSNKFQPPWAELMPIPQD